MAKSCSLFSQKGYIVDIRVGPKTTLFDALLFLLGIFVYWDWINKSINLRRHGKTDFNTIFLFTIVKNW